MSEPTLVEPAPVPVTRRQRYASINAIGLPRQKLDDREALIAARRLYLLGRKLTDQPRRSRPLKLKIVSGNRHTDVRRGRVNPCKGWAGLVHDVSHDVVPNHSPKHEWLERQLAEHVRDSGWLDGKLRRTPKPTPPLREVRRNRIAARLVSWERKLRRAQTAIKKLKRSLAYYDRVV